MDELGYYEDELQAMPDDLRDLLEKTAAAFKSDITTVLTDYANDVIKEFVDDENDVDAAVKAYFDDLSSRQAGLDQKKENLKRTIEQCAADSQEAVELLGEALSSDDADAEGAAKETIDKASMAEFMAKQKLDALDRVRIKGSFDLYFEALESYRVARAYGNDSDLSMRLVIDFLDRLKMEIDSIQKICRRKQPSDYRARVIMKKMWKVIEAFGGPVDFKGEGDLGLSPAGDEEACKIRFLDSLAQREVDPAFAYGSVNARLAGDIDALIEHEEEHEDHCSDR